MKAIVRAGLTPVIHLRNMEVIRAITLKEVYSLISSMEDVRVIIIEDLKEEEKEALAELQERVNIPIITRGIGENEESRIEEIQLQVSYIVGMDVCTFKHALSEEQTEQSVYGADLDVDIFEDFSESKEDSNNSENSSLLTAEVRRYSDMLERAEQGHREYRENSEREISKLKEQIKVIESEKSELIEKVNNLKVEKVRERENSESTSIELDITKNRVRALLEDIEQYKTKIQDKEAEVKGYRDRIGEIESEREEVETEISSMKSDLITVTASLDNVNSKLQQKENENKELENKLREIDEARASEKEQEQSRIELIRMEVDAVKMDNQQLLEDLEDLKKCLTGKEEVIKSKDSEIEDLRNKYGDVDKFTAELEEKNRKLEENTVKLEENIKGLNETLRKVEKDKADIRERGDESIKVARENIKKLKDSIESIEKDKEVKNIRRVRCEYMGNAKVITVSSGGGCGGTTVALSICSKLKGNKVLIMDFNMLTPKIELWYRTAPIITELSGKVASDAMKTAMGAFIELGADYVIDNIEKLVIHPSNESGLSADYFGGALYSVPQLKLSKIELDKLMNKLGNIYDYIIVNTGVLDTSMDSGLHSELLKCAHKNIIVTHAGKDAVSRALKVKLGEADIDEDKVVWVINMAESGAISRFMERDIIGESDSIIMPHDNKMVNTTLLYGSMQILKDKLNSLMKCIL